MPNKFWPVWHRMLSSPALLFRTLSCPQTARLDGSVPEIAIVDVDSGLPVGAVHRGGARWPWSRWLEPSAWEIFETDDLSHVFSLHRSWPWSAEWAVHDSEGRQVGTVRTPPARWADVRLFFSDVRRPSFRRVGETRIEDGQGSCVARLQENGHTRRFVTMAGAAQRLRPRGRPKLTFADAVAGNPFTHAAAGGGTGDR